MPEANSHTEWGQLQEVIVGIAHNAQIPRVKNKDIHCVDYANYDSLDHIQDLTYSDRVLKETQEDLDRFAEQLQAMNIMVHRPVPLDLQRKYQSPHWETDGYYQYCPRDIALVVGDTIIETPMVLRSRYFEAQGLQPIFHEYFVQGSNWVSAPKPCLHDELYDRSNLDSNTLTETEIAFDAANVIKCGKDLFYLVSNSGNVMGAKWLQRQLGSDYRIHVLTDIYAYVHLDTSIMPLAPGKVLMNPSRVNDNNMPNYFKNWDIIWAPEPIETPCDDKLASASPWLSMNVLSINEHTVVVEERQQPLIDLLESQGFDVMPVKMRHCRTLSGGPHCVTLDTVRKDKFEDFS